MSEAGPAGTGSEAGSEAPGFVIVGAGECGTRAALALREAGYDGPVTLVGTEIHTPYERPPLSKDAIAADMPEPKTIGGADGLAERGIVFRPGVTVVSLDRAAQVVVLSDGTRLAYHRLLLATGARPRALPVPGIDGPNVATLRGLEDAARIRAALGPGRRLAVIGGGFIGLELAASARRLGTEVTVIEALPRLLSRGVPEEVAGILAARHEAEGVRLIFGARIVEVTGDGVALEGGITVPADLVLVGIGAVPETALAEAAGLAIDNGIAVDDRLATSDPAIFAAGDCAAFLHPGYGRRIRLESWRSAQEQGTLAARNMLGAEQPVSAVPWFWSDQYDLTLQIAGLAEGSITTVRRPVGEGFVLFHLGPEGRLLAASGVGPGNAVAKDIRLAEMLIARGAHPDPEALATVPNLKKLLSA
ncbi:3-phenylpropionate/trans-cinnamate dioxygenase ferredoxin reductase subunit [Amaricoccus macauensis]|uniref:3-phenylpropionate/trans-cinnamate dioxygenase ferredoxin reductase subunit n=1 Tax=Amaricoccus macauensis TaxID=57001 RepID=A0A840SR76_9RHOB|nr:FAD-dependent oxidoreductase [Amaricoccus macauensis]MBB5223270.1 3-phenylpropionate/trans-cinnamate dioxygenase ferredoxin reductase subunit [Amaricoccus macauensis]